MPSTSAEVARAIWKDGNEKKGMAVEGDGETTMAESLNRGLQVIHLGKLGIKDGLSSKL